MSYVADVEETGFAIHDIPLTENDRRVTPTRPRIMLPRAVVDHIWQERNQKRLEEEKRASEVENAMNAQIKANNEAKLDNSFQLAKDTAKPPSRGYIRVFSDVDKAKCKASEKDTVLVDALNAALAEGGMRKMPNFKKAAKALDGLHERFANFGGVIERLKVELVLASRCQPAGVHFSPILLQGDPGTGKTAFAMSIAELLGVPMEKFSAGSAQAAFQLNGTDKGWSNAQPGRVFYLLSNSKSAVAVLLIDEVDKMSNDSRHPIMPLLLDLLEPVTSKVFKDQCLDVTMDASKLIVIMTSNDLQSISPPLLSRVELFEIQPPSVNQKRQIIVGEIERLKRATNTAIAFDEEEVSALAQADVDLRKVLRVVANAYARALTEKSQRAKLMTGDLDKTYGRRRIGFIRS